MNNVRMICIAAGILLNGCTGELPTSDTELLAAKQAFDSQLLVDSIERIKRWHVNNKTGVAEGLGAGITHHSLVEKLREIGCYPTVEMRLVWAWHNGSAPSASPFVWYHDFLPVDEAISEYRKLMLNPLVPWDSRYVPVFVFEGEWYALYCSQDEITAGPVAHLFLEDQPRITHKNLTTYLAGMAAMLQERAIIWKDGAMVENIDEIYRIHQEFNPGYEFPYYVPDGTQPRDWR